MCRWAAATGNYSGVWIPSAGKDGTLVAPAIAESKLTVYLHVDPALPAQPRPIGDVGFWSNQTRRFGNEECK